MALNPQLSDRSQVVFQHPVELATHLALKAYNRTFHRADVALYLAQIVVRVQGQASDAFATEIDQVNAAIDQELRRLEESVTTAGGWIENRLKKARRAVPVGAGVSYTDPVTATLAARTPKARRYARLLGELDQTLRRLDLAWYEGVIEDSERLRHNGTLFRSFQRACGVIERLARGLAQRVREDAREPAPAYAEMLVKRTGRGPGMEPEPDVVDAHEDAPLMTPDEAHRLQAMEALAADLDGRAPGAESPPTVATDADANPASSEALSTPPNEAEADPTPVEALSVDDAPTPAPEAETEATETLMAEAEASLDASGADSAEREASSVEAVTVDRPAGKTRRLRDALRHSGERTTV